MAACMSLLMLNMVLHHLYGVSCLFSTFHFCRAGCICTGLYAQKVPVLRIILCCHHLDILKIFNEELTFCFCTGYHK